MPRGGKRKGAGAPKGNTNALKHGGRAKVLFGIPLDKELTRVEYLGLCLTQLEYIHKHCKRNGFAPSNEFLIHSQRYGGAVRGNVPDIRYRW